MILALVVILGIVGLALLLRPWPFFLNPEEPQSYRDRNVAVEFVLWVERHARAGAEGARCGAARAARMQEVRQVFQLFRLSRRSVRALLARLA